MVSDNQAKWYNLCFGMLSNLLFVPSFESKVKFVNGRAQPAILWNGVLPLLWDNFGLPMALR